MRRRVPWGLVAALFVVVPLLEIYLVIQAGQWIGVGPTIVILIVDSLLGAALLKREGSAAWRRLVEAVSSYRLPARELADGAVVLVGGTLLLTPGFFTDALGFFFILPFTRPIARRVLTGVIARRLQATSPHFAGAEGSGPRTRPRPGPDDVVQGEVVD
jgi:UPF0716 protein FxsA